MLFSGDLDLIKLLAIFKLYNIRVHITIRTGISWQSSFNIHHH